MRVKVRLLDRCENIPLIEDYQVYNVIKGGKKSRSGGLTGDIPKKLIDEFSVELTAPIASIFRSIMKTNQRIDCKTSI